MMDKHPCILTMHQNYPASVFTDVPCGVLELLRKRGVAACWHVESVAGKNTVTFNGENRDGELMILQGKMFSVCVCMAGEFREAWIRTSFYWNPLRLWPARSAGRPCQQTVISRNNVLPAYRVVYWSQSGQGFYKLWQCILYKRAPGNGADRHCTAHCKSLFVFITWLEYSFHVKKKSPFFQALHPDGTQS